MTHRADRASPRATAELRRAVLEAPASARVLAVLLLAYLFALLGARLLGWELAWSFVFFTASGSWGPLTFWLDPWVALDHLELLALLPWVTILLLLVFSRFGKLPSWFHVLGALAWHGVGFLGFAYLTIGV